MPQRLAVEAAKMISRCQTDAEVREAVLNVLVTAAGFGFNHGNPEFVQALCDALRELADAETDAAHEQRLRAAIETVCTLADELQTG